MNFTVINPEDDPNRVSSESISKEVYGKSTAIAMDEAWSKAFSEQKLIYYQESWLFDALFKSADNEITMMTRQYSAEQQGRNVWVRVNK